MFYWHVCSVSSSQRVSVDTTEDEDKYYKAIPVGGLEKAETYFVRVVPFSYFRGMESNASLGVMVIGECCRSLLAN